MTHIVAVDGRPMYLHRGGAIGADGVASSE
jgi:hypothetical protein